MWTFWTHAMLLSQVIIQCRQSKCHHGFSCMAVNGCFAAHCFHPTVCFSYLLTTIHISGLIRRAQSLSRWTDQAGTAGWHPLALSRLPHYQAGVEQSLSQTPWRGCSVESRRWSPTAKRQLPGECCYGGSWSSALKYTYTVHNLIAGKLSWFCLNLS